MKIYAKKPSPHPQDAPSQHLRQAPASPRKKLKVSAPGDVYEREADRVAEGVTRAPEPQLQRGCACGEASRGPRAGRPPQVGALIQTKPARAHEAEGEVSSPAVEEVLRSPGQPLAADAREFFAPRLGHDFSQVRVHADGRAAESARSLNALAYTVGRHVVFGAGQYAPGTGEGRRLLAHELTHVLQQSGPEGAGTPLVQREPTPGAATESEEEVKGREEEEERKRREEEERKPQFTYSAGLDPDLKARFNRMVVNMNRQGIGHGGIDDVRPKGRAHILSTAHHIHTRQAVPVSSLQALAGGQDLDGNQWYKRSWEQMPTLMGFGDPREATGEEILEQARDNAYALAASQGTNYVSEPYFGDNTVNCAYEGYEKGDAHRKPNVEAVPLSNHVVGRAVDLAGVEWDKLGGAWSTKANEFVASFGLTRPYVPGGETYCTAEPWHFELAP